MKKLFIYTGLFIASSIFILTGLTPWVWSTTTPSEHQLLVDYLFDYSDKLSPEEKQRINSFLNEVHQKKDIEFFAFIVPNTGTYSIDEWSENLFQKWKIGDSSSGRGMLIVLSEEKKQTRLKVSKRLKPAVTEDLVNKIEHNKFTPYFEQNQMGPGFEKTLEHIIHKIEHMPEMIERTQPIGRTLGNQSNTGAKVKQLAL